MMITRDGIIHIAISEIWQEMGTQTLRDLIAYFDGPQATDLLKLKFK